MSIKIAIFAIVALAAVASAISPPTFPQAWNAVETQLIDIHQGNYQTDGNNVCCSLAAGQCKIQTANQLVKHYFDLPNNRTRFSNPDGTGIVTLYNDLKEYAVDANGNCQSFCPTDEDQLFPFGLDPNASYTGKVTVDGKTYDAWEWKETILGVVTMEKDTFLVDTSVNPPIPFRWTMEMTPFGQDIGSQSITYQQFNDGPQPAGVFDVKGKAQCPENPNCNNNQARYLRRVSDKASKTMARARDSIRNRPIFSENN